MMFLKKTWTNVVLIAGGMLLVSCIVVQGQAPSGGGQPPRGINADAVSAQPGFGRYGIVDANAAFQTFGISAGEVDAERQRQGKLAEILQQYEGAADDAAKAPLREQMSELLTQSFEARQERRAAEIADLEKRVAKLKELHKKRDEMKKTIVANRLRQIVEDKEGLGWGDDAAATGPQGSFGPFGGFGGGFGSGFGGTGRAFGGQAGGGGNFSTTPFAPNKPGQTGDGAKR
jgi:hypothetical protein